MGKLEQRSHIRTRSNDLQKIILGTVAAAGVLGIALVAPNVLKSMYDLGFLPRQRQDEYTRSSASKMVKKGLLAYDGKRYRLTADGERMLHRWQMIDSKLDRPKRWDGKWRVMIFDIPEKLKGKRNALTRLLRQGGFRRLQDSVWVYPYDCEDILTLLKTDLGVGKYVLYMIVEELENDKRLRQEFAIT